MIGAISAYNTFAHEEGRRKVMATVMLHRPYEVQVIDLPIGIGADLSDLDRGVIKITRLQIDTPHAPTPAELEDVFREHDETDYLHSSAALEAGKPGC